MDTDKTIPLCEESIKAWLLLLKAVGAIRDEIRHMPNMQANEISPGQLAVLINLDLTENPPTQVELSRLLLVTEGNVTAVLNTLEQKGFVKKKPDRRDGRLKRITLTGHGRAVMKKILPEIDEKIASIFRSMGKKNIEALSGQLVSLLMVFPQADEFMESINSKIGSIRKQRGGLRNAGRQK